jgi:hypothetical protein
MVLNSQKKGIETEILPAGDTNCLAGHLALDSSFGVA